MRLAALAALLVAATLAVHGGIERYQPAGSAMIENPAFDPGPGGEPERWELRPGSGEVVAEDGVLRLHNGAAPGTVTVRQVVPLRQGVTALRVEAVVAAEEVRPEKVPLAGAAVYVVGRDPDGALAFGSHYDLVRLTGSRTPRRYADVFEVAPQAVEAVLFIELFAASGGLTVSDLRVTGLRDAPFFTLARWLLAGAWLAGGVAALAVLRRRLGSGAAVAVGTVAAAGAALLLLPWELRGVVLGAAQTWLGLEAVGTETIANAGHVVIFLALGLVARLVLAQAPWFRLVLGLVGLAVLGEVMQLLTDGRSAQAGDVLLNSLGGLAGLLAAGLLRAAGRRLRGRPGTDGLAGEER
ncbi:VanZ family protein [Marinimicrococcus flavescens]|uniref:VanZ family protein n=1 Tax=Marinimicrococcus flavescens TaxID=3031815 RepID=A0AAP3V1F5_9PROT|nr:VanZ family protein [Marinimicrococcus flavescens]